MKKYLILLVLSLCVSVGQAQQFKRIYLFDKFVQANIQFRNHTTSKSLINYDASNQTMLFMQGTSMMELTNAETVDTIKVGKRMFVPASKGFYEVVPMEHGVVYIDWLLKDVNIGSRGALGSVTQGSVHNLQMSDFGNQDAMYYGPYDSQSLDATSVYRRKNDNTYYIYVNGKLEKVKTIKHLQKLFPLKKDDITTYSQNNHIDMKDVPNALSMINYCLGIAAE